ncbi:MAG: glycosyltransferase family 4 protein [Beutenbergiaceae bacterium]
MTSVHARGDTRIAVKETATLQSHLGEVTLFVQDGLGPGTGPGGVPVIDVGTPPGNRLMRMLLGNWRMGRRVAAARPVVAHFHDPELIPAALWWKVRGIRVIFDVHEDLPRQVMSKPWLPGPLRRPVAALSRLAERVAGSAFDGIVTVTPTIAARFPANRTVLVQNFPDLAEMSFDEQPYGTDAQVLYIGSITAIRGVRTMVTAMSRVQDPDSRLVLAGTFRPSALEQHVRRLPGWDRVEFTGWADRAMVRRLLSTASLGLALFHPEPNHVQSQPNKLFEYLAAGLPIVASDFPHWRDLLNGHECALFVDPQDPEAVAAAIDWLLRNPDTAREMGERGRHAVRERFNWESESKSLLALYQQVSMGTGGEK